MLFDIQFKYYDVYRNKYKSDIFFGEYKSFEI